jgi:hypothetical protein
LDALIAFVLYDDPPRLKRCPALDAAVVHLLINAEFPQKFSRQDSQRWEKSTEADTVISCPWRPFSTDAVSEEALASLEEWACSPDNRLLEIAGNLTF